MDKLPSQMQYKERLEFLSQKLDRQGFLRSRVKIARIGIQEYDGVKLFRPPAEVIRSIPTFDNQLITNEHPDVDVTVENASYLQIGFVSNVRYRNGWLEALATITDYNIIKYILEGRLLEFSCGYDADIVMEAGEYNGEQYDGIMTNIVGNHVALVGQARAGKEATFIDSKAAKPIILSNENNIDSTSTMDKDLEKTVSEELTSEVIVDSSELDTLKAELEALKAEYATLKDGYDVLSAQKDALDIKLNDSANSRAEIVKDLTGEEIAARVEAWTTIKPRLNDSVAVNYGLTVPEVRKLWLAQELPNLADKIKAGSEAYISGLWDSVCDRLETKETPVADSIPEVKEEPQVDDRLISVLEAPLKDSVSPLEKAQQAYIDRLSANRG